MNIHDKVVVITGGSGGIGKALALYMAKEGGKIVVCYHSNTASAVEVRDEINHLNGVCAIYQLDVSDSSSVNNVFQDILQNFGKVEVLINAAGVSFNGISWKLPDDCWDKTIATNLTGAFLCSRAVLPGMRAQGWGRIINISSVVAHTGVPGTVAYAASKAGLEGMTRCIAAETASKQITVNVIALGYFNIGMISQVPEPQLTKIIQTIPVGRLGLSEEIIHTVDYLCSDAAGYVTGQTIHINGGLVLK